MFPGTRQTTAQLYMGLSLPGGGEVDGPAWQDFLDHEVTPLFPDGLTVFDAYGQWRGPAGREVRERSKVLTIILPADTRSAASLTAIAQAYKTRFHQQSVGIVTTPSCAAF